MNKKIIWTILLSVILGTSIFFGWFVYTSPKVPILNLPLANQKTDFITPKTIAPISKPKIKIIFEKPIFSAARNTEENKINILDQNDQIQSINLDGSNPIIPSSQIPNPNLAKTVWSKNGTQLIQWNGDDINNLFASYLDLKTNSVKPLGRIENAVFSPDSKKIAWQEIQNPQINNLLTSNTNGLNKRIATSLNIRDILLEWPTPGTFISLTSKPSGKIPGSLWTLNLANPVPKKILTYLGLQTLWSPQGSKVLFSYFDKDARLPVLAVADKNGQTLNSLGAAITTKCIWSQNDANIYCAVPKNWPSDAFLPDDYFQKKFFTQDDIWKINTQTGEKTLIASVLNDAYNLILSLNEDEIFYISRQDSKLYRVKIK